MRLHPALMILALVSACAPAPLLEVEPSVLSGTWSREPAPAETPRLALGALLGDPELERLVDAGFARNSDLAGAHARLDQAVALLRVARGASLPLISASAGVSGTRTGRGPAFDFTASVLRVDASVTPDVFGQERAKGRAAAARAAASYQDLQAVALDTSVQIARAYVARATLARRLRLIDTSINQARELDRIIRVRRREGAASMVEVGLQSIRLKELQAERTRIEEALDQTRTALAYLTGEEAPGFDVAPQDPAAFATPRIPVPAPAQLVETRPDVRAAEQRIRAAGGDVDAARRAFYPSLQLSLGGALSAGPGAPLALARDVGASILAPIFARNRLRGDLDVASAQQREAVSAYRSALLNALREVEDALSVVARAEERERLLTEVEREASTTQGLARQQYLDGAEDLQHLLDAQDLLISSQDAMALARQERVEGFIRLYAATGPSTYDPGRAARQAR